MPQQTTMQIGQVVERTGLSLHTLRHYHEVGLLRPSDRSEGGFRLYTGADVEKLLLIRRMKPLGFTLEQMGEVLRLVADLSEADLRAGAQQRLEDYLELARARREELRAQVAMADELVERLEQRRG